MRDERKHLFFALEDTFREALDDLSLGIGFRPEPIYGNFETTGPGESYAATFGIRGADVRITVSIIAGVPVVSGKYFQGYADLKGELLDDEAGLFADFADQLTKSALEKAGIDDIPVPPCQLMGGENFRNTSPSKSSVISFSLPFELAEGMLFINVSVFA